MKSWRLHDRLEAGIPAIGAILASGSTDLFEWVGRIGFDFVMIDCQHGPMSAETVLDLVRIAEAEGVAPLVRVPSQRPEDALRYLDVGAAGIVVPSVSSREEAEAAVASVRYPPEGVRAFAPAVRSAGYGAGLDLPEYIASVHRNTLVFPIIETAAGLAAADDILGVDGVSGIAIGPVDLSFDMGLRGDFRSPEVVRAKADLLAASKRHRKPALTAGSSREQILAEIGAGASMVMIPFGTWVINAGRAEIGGIVQ